MIRLLQHGLVLLYVSSIQPLQLISQTSYPKGVYKDLESLCLKNPDTELWQEVSVKKRRIVWIWFFGGNKFVPIAEVKSSEFRTWYAVSDGESLYINCGKQKNQQFGYAKVNSEGRYLSYTGVINKTSAITARIASLFFYAFAGYSMFAIPIGWIPIEYYLDTKTRVNRPLDKVQLQYLLIKDPWLAEMFEGESNQGKSTRIKYLTRLNESPFTTDYITNGPCKPTNLSHVFFYRLDKNSQRDEQIVLNGSDTISLASKSLTWVEFDNSFAEIEVCVSNGKCKTVSLTAGQSEYMKFKRRGAYIMLESRTAKKGKREIDKAREAQARFWRRRWRKGSA